MDTRKPWHDAVEHLSNPIPHTKIVEFAYLHALQEADLIWKISHLIYVFRKEHNLLSKDRLSPRDAVWTIHQAFLDDFRNSTSKGAWTISEKYVFGS